MDIPRPRVLVVDVGGSHVKLMVSGDGERTRTKSGKEFTPQQFLEFVEKDTRGWDYDVISVGIPAPVRNNCPIAEPAHLGKGWVDFDFEKAWGKPVRMVNDAALQALGSYRAGRMIFLGLGTGIGSALVVPGVILPLELCELRHRFSTSWEEALCKAQFKRVGRSKWQKRLEQIIRVARAAFLPDEIVIGGGNAKFVDPVPEGCRLGDNSLVLLGGERLWERNPGTGAFTWVIH
jgi:polyphosphate glucokinase